MCFKTKSPAIPPVRAAPSTDDTKSAVVSQRKRIGDQQGLYGNIFTTLLGDSNYGKNTPGRPQLASVGAS